ncbi:hypothetical protein K2Q16_02005 [Patescibacteria group bacterium]|nr:hypothetical protein [Patescibacteria group bacterium]
MGTLLIEPHILASQCAGLRQFVDYQDTPQSHVPNRLWKAVQSRCAVAIAGPARCTNLAALQLAHIMPGIEDEQEYTNYPFATRERCGKGWIGLRSTSNMAVVANMTMSEQLRGTKAALPNAVTLIWAMQAYQACNRERLMGKYFARTSSVIPDVGRIVVGQSYNAGPITVTVKRDDERSPKLSLLKLFS